MTILWEYFRTVGGYPERGAILQDDNAPVHRANAVKAYLSTEGIPNIKNWPSLSPDLNPIENVFGLLKRKLALEPPQSEAELATKVPEVWEAVCTKGLCRHLYKSMGSGCEKVIANQGCRISY